MSYTAYTLLVHYKFGHQALVKPLYHRRIQFPPQIFTDASARTCNPPGPSSMIKAAVMPIGKNDCTPEASQRGSATSPIGLCSIQSRFSTLLVVI
eukprot:3833665-Pyramimonas_sp.AAC.1